MSHNERGLQNKSDDNSRQKWESGDFPMVCESCLGDNPYLRMQKNEHAGNCKMCDRPYTVFKWRPGRGEGMRQTQVCQTCSKIKNLCQTCILDLQFGLPSQLRDAVLSQDDGTLAVPESDANREYFANQHLALLAAGNDPWQSGETPNEKLLKIARNAVNDREQTKTKLAVIAGKKRDASALSYARTSNANPSHASIPQQLAQSTTSSLDASRSHVVQILPPPGMTSEDAKALRVNGTQATCTSTVSTAVDQEPPDSKDIQSIAQLSTTAKSTIATTATTDTATATAKPARPKPPKPAGPPPAWAFKNK